MADIDKRCQLINGFDHLPTALKAEWISTIRPQPIIYSEVDPDTLDINVASDDELSLPSDSEDVIIQTQIPNDASGSASKLAPKEKKRLKRKRYARNQKLKNLIRVENGLCPIPIKRNRGLKWRQNSFSRNKEMRRQKRLQMS